MSAAITAIAPWFGGKRTLAPRIVEEIGDHKAYWEPFCGSLAVLLAKPQSREETVNDLNGDLVNLARVIASSIDAPELYGRLARTLISEQLQREAREHLRTDQPLAPIDRAYWYFVEAWQGRNGVAGTRQTNTGFCVRFTSNGGSPATRFRSAVESIPDWHQRLRNVTILSRDAFGILERIEDKAGTVIYADPPYIVKVGKYVHDFTGEDHSRLAAAVGRFHKTRVIVSYYDHPTLRTIYPEAAGFTFVNCATSKNMAQGQRRDTLGKVTAPEILIVNGPSYTARREAA